ncbi:MAG: tRNA (N6-isopentenyl adenosine(37)-C2)-methylthiotransferase MiaB [Deltaproteobacteria bacterium]|jgi:tRNA-2-methylthio-N6-dimethylallyladenosine synthase|nr:tRNA (N6-isopentenyl adenosine(37)-C2)-methylthiotransferase MiaB [Deltaproteobacteria bacterium]
MDKAFIKTFGCQMNEHDSSRIAEILKREGFEIIHQMDKADLVMVNTCSVRENPENKVYSIIGRLTIQKKKNPNLIIGICGCVAQQEGRRILKKRKAVDMVFGTDNIFKLPEILKGVRGGNRVLFTEWLPRKKSVQNFIPDMELKTGVIEGCKGQIAITKGCNNFCSYCIVPMTRGRLVSRELENILEEAKDLINKGAKEIMLLGQNVNSYSASNNEFYDLLKKMANLVGLQRLRFISPHPNDWNNALSDLMSEEKVICNQIHLPFQAGSNRVLKAMKRDHTAEEYLLKVDYLKQKIPDIVISTDIIVGYPSETEADFQETLNIMKTVHFFPIYAFKYSPRPGTKAAQLIDDIPTEIKEQRLEAVLTLQKEIQNSFFEKAIDEEYEIFIESFHPKEIGVMNGRTSGNISVSVSGNSLKIGDLVKVKIIGRKQTSLIGKPL